MAVNEEKRVKFLSCKKTEGRGGGGATPLPVYMRNSAKVFDHGFALHDVRGNSGIPHSGLTFLFCFFSSLLFSAVHKGNATAAKQKYDPLYHPVLCITCSAGSESCSETLVSVVETNPGIFSPNVTQCLEYQELWFAQLVCSRLSCNAISLISVAYCISAFATPSLHHG